ATVDPRMCGPSIDPRSIRESAPRSDCKIQSGRWNPETPRLRSVRSEWTDIVPRSPEPPLTDFEDRLGQSSWNCPGGYRVTKYYSRLYQGNSNISSFVKVIHRN